ncbi:ABC transporter substrate-binding protein [Devosia sp.]|uniref:ABC transporter substrate-binding protein n=1 Tax=Devosia sp. TaxID=1871048 RepID=UPI003A900C3D
MRIIAKGMLAGAGLMLMSSTSVLAQELTILWAEWDPANYLQELVNEYQAETGVRVTVETVPWPDFQTKLFTELNAQGSAYDLVVGDSQFLGAASVNDHYVNLTDFIAEHDLTTVMAPATMKYYSEYPGGSGQYWSVPLEGDALGWAYRKDWFEDPTEMANFKEKYGYDLGVPETFKQLIDIAEFFHRPEENRYGAAIYSQNAGDAIVMGVENSVFAYGGSFGNYETFKVTGEINSPKSVEALEDYRKLFTYGPPGWGNAFFAEVNTAIAQGQVAMGMNFFAFFPSLVNEATNPYAKDMGFFANPPGPYGDDFAALGGQGISVISYTQNKDEAMRFLEWFVKDDTQKRWAELGGYTASAAVLNSEEFQNATPFNKAFYETMFKVKDFWALPEYAELLTEAADTFYPYVVDGQGTAQETMDALAAKWVDTLQSAGYPAE